jgi:peptidoglycan/LPS O-acetylase OafA/YrhL/lysophospholipase L1-like esterase
MTGGFVGVDIFFVISGYLISSIIFANLEHQSFSIADFYSRRIRRIYPALTVMVIASLIVGWYGLFPSAYADLGNNIAASAAFAENFRLYADSGYFDSAAESKPMLHLWSLAVEEQFYIFWPLMLAFVWKRKWNFLAITAAIGVLSFAVNIYLAGANPMAAFYWPIARFWELMIGGMLAYLALHRKSWIESGRNGRSVSGFVLLACGFVFITREKAFPGWWGLMPAVGAVLVISAGAGATLNRYVLSGRFMTGIGLISYPLYLWHWPLLSLAHVVADVGFKARAALVALAVILAWLTYEFIEKPLRSNRKFVVPLFATMGLIGCFGYASYALGGFGFRLADTRIGIKNIAKVGDAYEYFDYRKYLRQDVCHSIPSDRVMANGCIEIREKNVFLWGDSYAASLYGGLRHVRDAKYGNFGISQLTDGNGPPFFTDGVTDDGKSLKQANEMKLGLVEKFRPDIVVMTWMKDGFNAIRSKERTLSELAVTVQKVRAASPGTRILIIGPFPMWRANLIQQLYSYYVFHGTAPPIYMKFGLRDSIKDWDDYLRAKVPTLGVNYVSSYDQFCNQAGCLTRTGSDVRDVVAVDYGHLTEPGAIFLVNGIQGHIFQ